MAGELNGIFNWVEMLGEVDVEGVPAMTSVVAQKLKWREDKVTDGGKADALMANAPEREDTLLRRAQGGGIMPRPTYLHDLGRGARRHRAKKDFLPRTDAGFRHGDRKGAAAQRLRHRDAGKRRWPWPTLPTSAWPKARRARWKACRWRSRICSAPRACAPRRRQQDPGQFRAAL